MTKQGFYIAWLTFDDIQRKTQVRSSTLNKLVALYYTNNFSRYPTCHFFPACLSILSNISLQIIHLKIISIWWHIEVVTTWMWEKVSPRHPRTWHHQGRISVAPDGGLVEVQQIFWPRAAPAGAPRTACLPWLAGKKNSIVLFDIIIIQMSETMRSFQRIVLTWSFLAIDPWIEWS